MDNLKSKARINVKKGSLRERTSVKSIKSVLDSPFNFAWPSIGELDNEIFRKLINLLTIINRSKSQALVRIGINNASRYMKSVSDIKDALVDSVFVCKGDIPYSQLYMHLFTLGCMYHSTHKKFRLIALPKGSLAEISKALGVKSALALVVSVPNDTELPSAISEAAIELNKAVQNIAPPEHPLFKDFGSIPKIEYCTPIVKQKSVAKSLMYSN